MTEDKESLNLMPAMLHVEITDDAEEARYTFGEMWFPEDRKAELLELASLENNIKTVKVMIHRRIYHFIDLYFDHAIETVKQEQVNYLKIKFGAGDLQTINEWVIPAKSTRR